jgi:hypothetical protein
MRSDQRGRSVPEEPEQEGFAVMLSQRSLMFQAYHQNAMPGMMGRDLNETLANKSS